MVIVGDLTTAQAAAALQCSPRQVRRLIAIGELAAYNIGTGTDKEYRITKEALDRFRGLGQILQNAPEPPALRPPYIPKILKR